MKNYSFSREREEALGPRNMNREVFGARHSELKNSEANQRIEQIKRKYDTPSRRDRIQSLKRSQLEAHLRPGHPADKENHHSRAMPSFGSSDLRESALPAAPTVLSPGLGESGVAPSMKESVIATRLERSTLREEGNCRGSMEWRSGHRAEEEAIFSKVREMKESIINQDRLKGSANGRSQFMGKSSLLSDGKKDYDPRVQNIDKINSKIKQILNCLNDNEKNQHKYLTAETSTRDEAPISSSKFREVSSSKKSYESHFQKKSEVLEKINVFDPTTPSYDREVKQTTTPVVEARKNHLEENYPRRNWDELRREHSATPVPLRNQEYSLSKPQPQKETMTRTPGYLGRAYGESRSALPQSRSRSQIGTMRKSNLAEEATTGVLKSGKKLNDEISRIQKKIEEFEKVKRRMNIEFTPFKHSSSRSLHKDMPGNKSAGNFAIPQRPRHSESHSAHHLNEASFGWNHERKPTESVFVEQEEVEKERKSPTFEKIESPTDLESKLNQLDIKTVRIDNQQVHDEEMSINGTVPVSPTQQQYDSEAIGKRIDEGIESRKRRLQSSEAIITSQSLKKLASLFCEQAKLDQNLRNFKIWLEGCAKGDKFAVIAGLLEERGVKMNYEESEKTFTVQECENNPFFSGNSFEGSLEGLADAYLEATAHWESVIRGKFERSSLLEAGFSAGRMDLEKKGFIELEDVVRFLNIESGSFYRNRDIYLIFQRLAGGERVSFEEIMGQICA